MSKKTNVAPYDLYDYTTFWQGRDYEDIAERHVLTKYYSKVENKTSLLDIGGGFGRLIPLYSNFFDECLMVDPSQRNINTCSRLYNSIANTRLQIGSVPHLKVESKSIGVAQMIRVSHHLSDLEETIVEIKRILSDDGYFILEIANKIHFMARVRAYLRADFSFCSNIEPIDQRSPEAIEREMNLFVNHSPTKVLQQLARNGFKVLSLDSVSNFRNPVLKKIIPQSILSRLEKATQHILGKIYFGPSIFVLARKSL